MNGFSDLVYCNMICFDVVTLFINMSQWCSCTSEVKTNFLVFGHTIYFSKNLNLVTG
jgi:hypothetical protein